MEEADLERARSTRSERVRLRSAVSHVLAQAADAEEVPRKRVCYCGWAPIGGQVAVRLGEDGIARYAGLQNCASIWLCPVCGGRIRQVRSKDIEQAATTWVERGGDLLFITLTVRHNISHTLKVLMEAVATSWSNLIKSAWWTGDKKRTGIRQDYGIEHYIRALEVTDGPQNGWHAHVHALLFIDHTMAPGAIESLGDEIWEKWAHLAVKAGADAPSREHGVNVQQVGASGQVLARYLSKVTADVGVGFEMARSDCKRGRKYRRYTPWELADAANEGDDWARERFLEYAAATFGRRCITWSRGLREDMGMGVELTNEEIIEQAEKMAGDMGDPVFTMTCDEWRAVRQVRNGRELILEYIEAGHWSSVENLVACTYQLWGVDTS